MDIILTTELERQKGKLAILIDADKAFISLSSVNLDDVIKRKLSLDLHIENLSRILDRYITAVPSPSEELATSCYEKLSEGQEIMIELGALIETQKFKPQSTFKNTKLPQLTLPKWNGDLLEFKQFFDRFESSVGNQDISDVDKLSYLLGCLEGKAWQAVQGIPTTNINYSIAIKTLQKQFGDESLVVDAHYKALSSLSQCRYDAEECRRHYNDIERHLRILQSLGENINSNHLRSLILDKFPERILYEVNLLSQSDKTVARIKEELNKIITAMELSHMKCVDTLPIASSSSTEVFQVHQTLRKNEKIAPLQQPRNTEARKRKWEVPSVNKGNKDNYNNTARERFSKRRRKSCIFCAGAHYNDECTTVKQIQDRKYKLQNRCFNCFGQGHQIRNCRRPKRCFHCTGPHNRALCPSPKKVKSKCSHNYDIYMFDNIENFNAKISTTFLQTATAWTINNKKRIKCRILLDCGSQRSYITYGLTKNLDLTSKGEDRLTIYTFGEDKPRETLSPSVNINIETRRGIHRCITVNVVPHITDRLPIPNYDNFDLVDMWADDGSAGLMIDILIGNDNYFSFLRSEAINIKDNLYLIDTEFGWVMSGHLNKISDKNVDVLSVLTYHQTLSEVSCFTEPDIPLNNIDIKFLWSLENIGITDSVKTSREEEAVQHFNKSCEYRNGRYFVKWPWTDYPPNLQTNYGLAYGRLKALLKRQDLPTLEEYDKILKDQLKAGIIEEIEDCSDPTIQLRPPVHYLPHHLVKQSGKPGRIVYDASAKTKDQCSLNECMYRGPCMLQDLTALLLNFRVNKIAIVADVEKAFLQIGLQEEDREVTRFLWVKDIKKALSNDNIITLRFCRVPFGIIASPFLLTSVIRYHITKRDSNLLDCIADKFYVDNLVTGAGSSKEAIQLYKTCQELFKELSMNLRDWSSNDKVMMSQIPKENRSKIENKEKVLGLIWEKKGDKLRLNTNECLFTIENKIITKREVLRIIASIYDPCGIISPLIIPAKLFLQRLWLLGYKWDTTLSQELIMEWKDILMGLRSVKDITIPRYIGLQKDNKEISYELHCFTDASNKLYSSVTYLRVDNGKEVKITLLMSKCRLVPLEKEKVKITASQKNKKTLTIPQLELLGCLIGSRLLTYIKRTIGLPISHSCLWVDSLVVLSWIKSEKLLTPWVENRAAEIRRNQVEMRYVNTKQNPADLATRPGVALIKLKTMWLQGPDFLLKPKEKWQHNVQVEPTVISAVVEGQEVEPPDDQQSKDETKSTLNETEICNTIEKEISSEIQRVQAAQREYYPEEMNGKETHLTRNLDLFKDIDGLLRCGGRMSNTDWPYETRHPILLPRDSMLTREIIIKIHITHYHVGVSHTLSLIRRMYWIPQGRSQVQKVLKHCPQCVKCGGGPYKLPLTPALPPERVRYESPFAYLGLDYLGPILVKTAAGKDKRWICLYTCLVVRSIHLEVVKDLTSEECLSAFRRFAATRGIPKLVLSDNALQFKLTAEVMTSRYCIDNKILWRFTPELAPWHGGVYERLISVVKDCLKRSLEKHLLNDTQLSTVIKEVEAVVNTRPLTCVSSEHDYILRPADFLSLGKCLVMNPLSDDQQMFVNGSSTKQDLIMGWKLGLKIIKEFKEMFIGRYLMSLRERYRHSPKQPRIKATKEPCVGDLVQIKGEHKNRQTWKVGRISSLIKGADGECRVAKVKVGNTEFTRSIGHLYPLEAEIEGDTFIKKTVSDDILPEMRDLGIVSGNEIMNIAPSQENSTSIQKDTIDISDSQVDIEVNKASDDIINENSVIGEKEGIVERVDTVGEDDQPTLDVELEVEEERPLEYKARRAAALRAKDKIREWTSLLLALL